MAKHGRMFHVPEESHIRIGTDYRGYILYRRRSQARVSDIRESEMRRVGCHCILNTKNIGAENVNAFNETLHGEQAV